MKLLSSNISSQRRSDLLLVWLFKSSALIAGLISVLILLFIMLESMPVLQHAGLAAFFRNGTTWYPKEELFNLTPMLTGSILAAFGGIVVAAPLGVLVALFCNYYAPPSISWIYRRTFELLSGIPSVVFGFWGLVFLVPWIGAMEPPGASLLAGILILAIMILPTMALSADAILRSFPPAQLQAASALGMSRIGTITRLILPAVGRKLFSALILQTGRALGETMALLMVAGNVVQNPHTIFDPIRTLTANMALEMAYATGHHRSALFVSGLILMALVIALMEIAQFFERGVRED